MTCPPAEAARLSALATVIDCGNAGPPGFRGSQSAAPQDAWQQPVGLRASDEKAGLELEGIVPQIRQMAVNNRLFAARAVAYAASQGAAQVIDPGGGGLMPGEQLHDVAGRRLRTASALYLDPDPLTAWELAGLLDGVPEVGVSLADYTDPDAALTGTAAKVINLDKPAVVVAPGCLHYLGLKAARDLAATWAAAVARQLHGAVHPPSA